MRKTAARFVIATLVLAVVAYLLKGRDRGLSFWVTLVGAAFVNAINLLARFFTARSRRD